MSPAKRANKAVSLSFQRLAGRQSEIAASLGISESAVSRFKSEQLEVAIKILTHAGLKVVPAEYRAYDDRQLEALFILVRGQLDRAESLDDLLQESDESDE